MFKFFQKSKKEKVNNVNNYIINMYESISIKCNYGEDIDKLNKYEKVFYVCQLLESEVNNGGFFQFFYNFSGIFTYELVDSFKEIKAHKTAEICKKAISTLNFKLPQNLDERRDLLDDNYDELEEKLESCDDSFYEYKDDLLNLNYQYISNNLTYFN